MSQLLQTPIEFLKGVGPQRGELLRKELGIEKIHIGIGGSMGGQQLLEWAIEEPQLFEHIIPIATNAYHSAWGVAFNASQRLAIEADCTWKEATPNAGAKGLKAARAIGMLTYRNYGIFQEKQTDEDPEKIDNFKASSYIEYQGDKLVKRFNAYSYWLLTKSMDSHHLARNRGGDLIKTLGTIQTPTFIMGINSDILCPLDEQRFIEQHMPNETLVAMQISAQEGDLSGAAQLAHKNAGAAASLGLKALHRLLVVYENQAKAESEELLAPALGGFFDFRKVFELHGAKGWL